MPDAPQTDPAETAEVTEILVPGPAQALASLIGAPPPDDASGLPLTWHWVYLLDRPATADLGRDGHPAPGKAVPSPPGLGLRRMWAGGQVRSVAPLRLGEPATRRTSVESSVTKQGRTGPLTFLSARHQVLQRDELVVDERQDLVYRDPSGIGPVVADEAGDPLPVEPGEWPLDVTPPLLFRYSALTYNGHRIHYDREYARTEEGYPGLVTHGPLQALMMGEIARREGLSGPGTVMDYRLVSPLFDHQGLVAAVAANDAGGLDTRVRDAWGRTTATGTVTRA